MTPARRKRDMVKADEAQLRIDEEKYVAFSVACNNEDAHGCHSLGEWFAFLRRDFAKAATLYEPNCIERGYANSCLNLGVMFSAGRGVEKDKARAMSLFERGCKLGNGDACDMAGRTLLERGDARGVEMLERGCEGLESAACCKMLGETFLVGRFGIKPDKPRAAALLEQACDRSEMAACRNLMVMYARGDGVPKDFAKAEAFRTRAIDAAEQTTGAAMPEYLRERMRKMHDEARS